MATQTVPKLETHPRERTGTRYARRLREAGRIPAVVYGHGLDPIHLAVDVRSFTDLLDQHAHLVELQIDGKAEPCLIKDVQWDHLGIHIIHADLTRVDLTEQVEVEVELELVGEPKALDQAGAILDHPENSLAVLCAANNIPEVIRVDISGLEVGTPLTVADLKLPEGVTTEADPETVIAQIQIMQEIEEPEPAEAEEAEPEVIARGGEKEEGEEGEEK